MRYRVQIAAGFLMGGAVALSSLLAKDPDASATQDAREKLVNPTKSEKLPETAAPPDGLEKLKLSDDQRGQIQRVVETYNAEINDVWKEFTRQYLSTISLESNLLAAIEDTLNDTQRESVRKQRARTAHAGVLHDGRDDRKRARDEGERGRGDNPGRVTEEGLVIVGVTLSPEQEHAADRIQASYFVPLRDAKREIHRLHARLLSLETDRLVEIEKLLTPEQLAQLRKDREVAPRDSTDSNSTSGVRNK